ncbi:protein lifeguard 1 [Trichonephila inaurata madagascariensis]|uniref:Protein lifeguard 1 n=1 Tax=Trichonephila inaurata madagascariensis TaxID=2747483 RepID=A0A8X6YXZ6_9ARAC|nr:protein lifeguard 1 [Trichonephila inaurata madagascariensis]
MEGYTDSEYAAFGADFGGSFSEKNIRMAFIRKVYAILMVQLAITFGFISLFVYNDSVKLFAQQHTELMFIAIILVFVLMIAMACCDNVRRTFPLNFICLFLFTFVESFLLGVASSTYEADEVMWAAGICAFICLGLTIFAFQTKYDFTMMGGMLFVALLIFVIFGFLSIFLHNEIVRLVYACVGALIFSLYLVYDTQLLIGGHHKYSISPEEYIFAALNLYLDIINLFIYILQIFGSRN